MTKAGSIFLTWSTSEGSPYACWSSSAAEEVHIREPRQLVGSLEHIYPLARSCHNPGQPSMSSGSIHLRLHSFPSKSPTLGLASGHTPCTIITQLLQFYHINHQLSTRYMTYIIYPLVSSNPESSPKGFKAQQEGASLFCHIYKYYMPKK